MAPQFILISPFSSENEQFLAGMYFICPAFHHFPATFSVTDRTTTQVRIRLNMILSSAHSARPETLTMTSRVDSVEDGRIVAGGTALAHLAGDQDVRQSLVLTARRQLRTAYIRTLSQRTRHIPLTCFIVIASLLLLLLLLTVVRVIRRSAPERYAPLPLFFSRVGSSGR